MDFDGDLNVVKSKWKSAGYYESSYLYNLLDFSIVVAFLALSLNIENGFLSGTFLGLSVHQYARLGHEIGHRSGIFNVHRMSDAVHTCFLMTINLFLGFDGKLWEEEHRQHHEYTMHTSDCQHDEEYPPIFTHNSRVFRSRLKSGTILDRILLPHQHNLAFPIVVLAGKVGKTIRDLRRIHSFSRRILIAFHYLFIAWTSHKKSAPQAFLHVLMITIVCGFLHLQLLFNHITTGEHSNGTKNDIRQQIENTVNYKCRPLGFWHWFHVSLSHQIEHHIDPKVASEHQHKLTDDVKTLCANHDIEYKIEDFVDMLVNYRRRLKCVVDGDGKQR
jgi:fatty acid desaturase